MKNKILLFLFPAILFSCTIYITWVYGFHFPFSDQWDFVNGLEIFHSNKLNLTYLFAQHNEHRIFFPRVIMFFMAYFTNWNIGYEIIINFLLGFSIFLVIYKVLDNVFDFKNKPIFFGILSVANVSLLFLSMIHYENWTWGWQIQIFLNILMVILGIMWLNKSEYKIEYFIFAILAGIVATFSFANGMFFWVIGGLMILTFQKITFQQKIQYLSCWILVFVCVFSFYMWGYQSPAGLNKKAFTVDFITKYISFVIGYFGIWVSNPNDKFNIGVLSLLLQIIGITYFYQKKILFSPQIRIFWLLSFYTIISAMVSGLGRADFGEGNNILTGGVYHLAPRYILISSFFWLFNFVFLFTLVDRNMIYFRIKKLSDISVFIFSIALLVILVMNFILLKGHISGIADAKEMYKRTLKASQEIKKENPDFEILKSIYNNEEIILNNIKILKKRKLAGFH